MSSVHLPVYRLMIRPSRSKSKRHSWEILDDSNHGICVETSKRTFRSMEEAYNDGKNAWDRWRNEARRQLAAAGALGQKLKPSSGSVKKSG
jgi:hypothetical protein